MSEHDNQEPGIEIDTYIPPVEKSPVARAEEANSEAILTTPVETPAPGFDPSDVSKGQIGLSTPQRGETKSSTAIDESPAQEQLVTDDEDDFVVGTSYEREGVEVDYEESAPILKPRVAGAPFILKDAVIIPGSSWNVFEKHMTDEQSLKVEQEVKALGRGENAMDTDWLTALFSGIDHVALDDKFKATIERAGAQWRQLAEHNEQKIWATRQTLAASTSGEVLRGNEAVAYFRQAIGVGSMVNVPLWHSGIWVTLRTPGTDECWALETAIQDEKEILGRQTHGLVFSNSSVYLNKSVINFILKHVEATTLKEHTRDLLLDNILLADLPLLAWGMLCSMYPTGYDYGRPCTADVDNCNHLVTALLNITKLLWVDIASIPDTAVRHMSLRRTKHPIDVIQRYQDNLRPNVVSAMRVNENLSVTFHQPTIGEHIDTGDLWIRDIVKQFDGAFTGNYSQQERENYLESLSRVTRARLYAHYYKEFIITLPSGDVKTITDRSDIDKIVNDFTYIPETADQLIEAVRKYIEEYQIAVVGIPNYACPSCGKMQQNAVGAESTIIPLEVMGVFFTLMRQRVTRMTETTTTSPTGTLD